LDCDIVGDTDMLAAEMVLLTFVHCRAMEQGNHSLSGDVRCSLLVGMRNPNCVEEDDEDYAEEARHHLKAQVKVAFRCVAICDKFAMLRLCDFVDYSRFRLIISVFLRVGWLANDVEYWSSLSGRYVLMTEATSLVQALYRVLWINTGLSSKKSFDEQVKLSISDERTKDVLERCSSEVLWQDRSWSVMTVNNFFVWEMNQAGTSLSFLLDRAVTENVWNEPIARIRVAVICLLPSRTSVLELQRRAAEMLGSSSFPYPWNTMQLEDALKLWRSKCILFVGDASILSLIQPVLQIRKKAVKQGVELSLCFETEMEERELRELFPTGLYVFGRLGAHKE
jgi:hypothetical protein